MPRARNSGTRLGVAPCLAPGCRHLVRREQFGQRRLPRHTPSRSRPPNSGLASCRLGEIEFPSRLPLGIRLSLGPAKSALVNSGPLPTVRFHHTGKKQGGTGPPRTCGFSCGSLCGFACVVIIRAACHRGTAWRSAPIGHGTHCQPGRGHAEAGRRIRLSAGLGIARLFIGEACVARKSYGE